MAYDQTVPQATQTIAQTQPIINDNFRFLQAAIGKEHNFDPTDDTKTYHLQASMPNQADPGSLPTGTDGMYYVGSGQPKFYNTADGAEYIQRSASPTTSKTGTANLTTSYSNVTSIPDNSYGTLYMLNTAQLATDASAVIFFVRSFTDMLVIDGSGFSPHIDFQSVAGNIQAKTTNAIYNGAYKFTVIYYTP